MVSYKKCSGCGIVLQNIKHNQLGYVETLTKDYCYRCFRLTHYNELIHYNITKVDFLAKLQRDYHLNWHYFYVLDIYDLDGSRNFELEQLIQNNKITLIINKIDLVDKLINKQKIISYISELFTSSIIFSKIEDIILVSGFNNYGLDKLWRYLKCQTNNVVFVGSSNTGKSTLLNSLIKLTKQQQKITVSNNIATTLDKIVVNLGTRYRIYDTPGIVNEHSIVTYLANNDKRMITKQLLKPITFQLNAEQAIFYEGLAIFSYLQGGKTSFHFYKNNNLKLHRTKLMNKDYYFRQNLSTLSIRLKNYWDWIEREIEIKEPGNYSLFIAGLGWISFKGESGQKMLVGINQKIKIKLRKQFI